jgi:hypothetical protein
MLRAPVAIALSLLVIAGSAKAQNPYKLGLFADTTCSSCSVTIPVGESRDIYVASDAPEPILGAEFRILGLPTTWQYVVVPAPGATLVLGDPFVAGANIAFSVGFPTGCAVLYRITVFAATSAENVVLQVVQRNPPSNPQFQCPRLYPDCGPCFVVLCAVGGQMQINGGEACTVGVSRQTWSAAKRLYRGV